MQAIDPHQAIRDAFEAACKDLACGHRLRLHPFAGGGLSDPLPLFGPDFVLEPQAQIVCQRVSFDDANDGTPKRERRGGYCDPRSNHPQLARRCQWRRDIDPGITNAERCEAARLALIEYAKARSADETLRALCLQK